MKSTPNSYSSHWVSQAPPSAPVSIDSRLSWVDSADGPDNPRYKQQIRDAQNASTNFVGTKSTVQILQEPEGKVEWWTGTKRDQYNVITFTGFPPGAMPAFQSVVASPDFSSADNAALGQFYSQARQAMSAMQGMTFLGEIAETIHMLRNPAKGLIELQRSLLSKYAQLLSRTRKGVKRKSLEKAIADLYLENVFGWLPLIHDISDAVKAYDRLLGKVVTSRCRGFGKDPKQVLTESGNESLTASGSFYEYTTLATSEAQVLYYGAVKGTATGASTLERASDLFGFRADEFVPTLWELMPWSFLIDYFANIGAIISAATYVNANLAWCSKTTRFVQETTRTSIFDRKAFGQPSAPVVGGGGYAWKATRTKVVRTASVSPGVPTLQFHLPGSDARWTNIAALALQSTKLSSAFNRLIH